MIVHDTQPYMTRIGGHWEEITDEEGRPQAILVGGVDRWVCPPPEHHEDTCPCLRCVMQRETLKHTRDQIDDTEVQENYQDPGLTPEDLERLNRGGA